MENATSFIAEGCGSDSEEEEGEVDHEEHVQQKMEAQQRQVSLASSNRAGDDVQVVGKTDSGFIDLTINVLYQRTDSREARPKGGRGKMVRDNSPSRQRQRSRSPPHKSSSHRDIIPTRTSHKRSQSLKRLWSGSPPRKVRLSSGDRAEGHGRERSSVHKHEKTLSRHSRSPARRLQTSPKRARSPPRVEAKRDGSRSQRERSSPRREQSRPTRRPPSPGRYDRVPGRSVRLRERSPRRDREPGRSNGRGRGRSPSGRSNHTDHRWQARSSPYGRVRCSRPVSFKPESPKARVNDDLELFIQQARSYSDDRVLYTQQATSSSNDRVIYTLHAGSNSDDCELYTQQARGNSDDVLYTQQARSNFEDRVLYTQQARGNFDDRVLYTQQARYNSDDRELYTQQARYYSDDRELFTPQARSNFDDRELYSRHARSNSDDREIYIPQARSNSDDRELHTQQGRSNFDYRELYTQQARSKCDDRELYTLQARSNFDGRVLYTQQARSNSDDSVLYSRVAMSSPYDHPLYNWKEQEIDGLQEGEKREPFMGYRRTKEIETLDPNETTFALLSSKSGFKELLQADVMNSDWVGLLLGILERACSQSSYPNLQSQLLRNIQTSRFMEIIIPRYLTGMSIEQSHDSQVSFQSPLLSLLIILKVLLTRMPKSYTDVMMVVNHTDAMIRSLRITSVIITQQIEEQLSEVIHLRDDLAERLRTRGRVADGQEVVEFQPPPEEFRDKSIFPQVEDMTDEKPFLKANKVKGGFPDVDTYLDVQFRLLREDFVRPLREGIGEYLDFKTQGGSIRQIQNVRLYEGVRILYPVCTHSGTAYRIKFDMSKMKRIKWENSRRLMFGSLLCLSNDEFRTLLVATVTDRKPKDLENGELEVQFESLHNDWTGVKADDVFTMVETSAFFEAYRHVLKALQDTNETNFPFQEYIIKCELEVMKPPAYLLGKGIVSYDLTSLFKENIPTSGLQATPVLTTTKWPRPEYFQFDDSQLKAVQAALTREFVVIQGPPGTGKTYIGLKIVEVLLRNNEYWQGSENTNGNSPNSHRLLHESRFRPVS